MTPPRLASWLLGRVLDPDSAEAIAGDLSEEFSARVLTSGMRAARRRYWRDALVSIATYLRARWRTRDVEQRARDRGRKAGLMDGFRHDLRFTFRTLASAPGFAIAAILTLALGIGAATAIATAANRALLRPLPFPTGDRLVFAGHPQDDGTIGNVGFATVVDWRAAVTSFDEIALIKGWAPTLVGDSGAERLSGMRVNWNYFRMLGVRPALGRDFTAADDSSATWRVVLISDGLWRRRFGGRADIVGSSLVFNGRNYQVAGVMPASFEPLVSEHFYTRADIWAPLGYDLNGDSSCRSCQHLRAIGRLRADTTLAQAAVELAGVQATLKRDHPSDYTDAVPMIRMLDDEIRGSVTQPLMVLVGAVGFVLLVACANVAGLLVARAADREREIALRAALGAGRGRIIRQLLTESLVLATAAGVLGLLLARWGLALLARNSPVTVPGLDQAAADPVVLAIGAAVAALALLGFGLVPAWTTARLDLQAVLREGRQSAGRRALRAREILMTAEVAMALLLIAGAGLMYRTVDRLLHVDPGFDSRGVLTVGLSLVGPAWAEDSAVLVFQDELLQRVKRMPGVEHAALAGQVPLGDNYDRWGFHIEGRTYGSEADAPEAERYAVTPDYFRAMHIPLRAGRLFGDDDTQDSPLVVVINETAARTLWPGADPIGARVRLGGAQGKARTIVGVVGDVRHYELGRPATPQVYWPQRQAPDSYLMLVVRSASDPLNLVRSIRREVAAIGPDVPLYDIATLTERMSHSVASRTFLMFLLGLFALTSLVLAAVGLYGVVSQAVGGRRREFGVRIALGARSRDLWHLVLGGGLKLVGVGVVLGLAGAVLVGRLLGSQLYETTPADPLTLGLAATLLTVVALAAHLVPLRRATHVDPAITLRNQS